MPAAPSNVRVLLVRSWNLFHGNTVPPSRTARLAEMVRLATADDPDVVCLQEVPVWALERLDDWTGMAALGDVARAPRIGPLPASPELGRRLTALNAGLLRSAFAGQANAILVSSPLRPLARHVLDLNAAPFRRAQARWLALPAITRVAWAKERRICQAVRLALPDGRTAAVANLHATAYPPDERLADAELLRAAVFADAIAAPDDVCIVAGDFNVRPGRSWTLGELTGPEWGFVGDARGIDQVLVRGARVRRIERWPDARRRLGGVLLSDHAPVEADIE